MADETRQLAQFVANLTYEEIPLHVRSLGIEAISVPRNKAKRDLPVGGRPPEMQTGALSLMSAGL